MIGDKLITLQLWYALHLHLHAFHRLYLRECHIFLF
jgi:hypothetical protein